ncbi:MAG: NAD(P)/FAD-dependent oxidoreductase [Chloroflexi bacterium]|nr:NAD(P)/FAD-dependent oxidoreductase [Chloroflexota bacterium]MCI0775005.1 NAD(P)/FAD-dependent oxidoreductase [Chloroflexota bacterium]
MSETFDVVIIGAGPAGEIVGERAVKAGLSAVVVENELVGGECSYWACMPSKVLLRPGEALRAVRRVPGARRAVTGEIDLAEALKRRDDMISDLDDKWQVKWLDDTNIDLIRGHARITGEKLVGVTAKDGNVTEVGANKAVVIATGSVPTSPPIPGLAESEPWDSRVITNLAEPPESLIIIGGGVVGVEMAQAWKDLGTRDVTILERDPRLLAREEPFAGDHIEKVFTEEYGIKVLTGADCTRVERVNGKVVVTCDDRPIEADEVLVATGRRANTSDIGLEKVGLEPGRFVPVDDQMRVTAVEGGWLFAVGDANGRSMLTHDGKYQGRIAGDVIGGKDIHAYGDIMASPRVVFTDPHVAAVGLTEAAAKEKGLNVRAVDYGFGSTAGAATFAEGIEGNVRIVVDEDSRTIVGATFVGPGSGEMLHAATIAIVSKITLDDLWHATPAFPTISEFWLRLLEAYGL